MDKASFKEIQEKFQEMESLLHASRAEPEVNPSFLQDKLPQKRRISENRIVNYYTRLQNYQNNPDWYVIKHRNGFEAFEKSSLKGKQHTLDLLKIKKDQDFAEYIANNPVEMLFDELQDRENVTRIELRIELDKIHSFTPERLQSLVNLLEIEGVEIK